MSADGDQTSTDVSSLRPTPETVPLGVVLTDLTCEGCGYNLYSQAIARDERLGIPVCRCPECGRFNVPGKATDAGRAWLRRLGVALLVLYVLTVLWVFGL